MKFPEIRELTPKETSFMKNLINFLTSWLASVTSGAALKMDVKQVVNRRFI